MKVFLSHAHQDQEIADKVREFLARSEIEVTNFHSEVTAGESLISHLDSAIERCDAMLVFISRNSEKSRWIDQEIALAVSKRHKGKNILIVPLIVDRGSEVPFFLKDYLYLDISEKSAFTESMKKLLHAFQTEKAESPSEELESRFRSIEIERELMQAKRLEYEEYRKNKNAQISLVAIISTVVAALAASASLLSWTVKIEFSSLGWLAPFVIGALSSVAVLYGVSKQRNRAREQEELIKRLHTTIKELEAHHEQ